MLQVVWKYNLYRIWRMFRYQSTIVLFKIIREQPFEFGNHVFHEERGWFSKESSSMNVRSASCWMSFGIFVKLFYFDELIRTDNPTQVLCKKWCLQILIGYQKRYENFYNNFTVMADHQYVIFRKSMIIVWAFWWFVWSIGINFVYINISIAFNHILAFNSGLLQFWYS